MWNLCRVPLKRSLPALRPALSPKYARYSAAAAAVEEDLDDASTSAPPAPPAKKFKDYQGLISSETLKAITDTPYQHVFATDVQAKVLDLLPKIAAPYDPASTTTRDLLVRARTGTGKTLAFLVPLLEARKLELEQAGRDAVKNSGRESDPTIHAHGKTNHAKSHVGALIISPTRELATQIANEALKLSYHQQDMQVQLLCGGANKAKQVYNWDKGTLDIVVATPGRLLDLINSDKQFAKDLSTTRALVLDEADTLLEMGFRDDLEALLRAIPPKPKRQTLLFSATVSPAIRQITKSFLAENHIYIDCVGNTDPVHMTVPQFATTLPSAKEQIPHILKTIMHDQLIHPGSSKVILFLPTTKMTQLFASFLRNLQREILPSERTEVWEIHSKLTQIGRTNASNRFRIATKPSILVTSDVSARGVDYPNVTRVIQVGIPSSRDQYVHRIGRTGRGTSKVPGRGDLVLLPFEVGFLTWQLTDIPLKALTTKQLDDQLAETAAEFDRQSGAEGYKKLVTPLVELVGPTLDGLLRRIDPEAVRMTFLSQLGYYLAKGPELRVQKPVILEGLNSWSVEACGLEEPPYVSPAFLSELGLNDGRTKHWGSERRQTTPSTRSSPWAGRGRQSQRDLPKEVQQEHLERDPTEAGLDTSEFRGQRFNAKPRFGDRNRSEGGGFQRPRRFDNNNGDSFQKSGDGGYQRPRRSNDAFGSDRSGGGFQRSGGGGGFNNDRDGGSRPPRFGGGGGTFKNDRNGGGFQRNRPSGDGFSRGGDRGGRRSEY